MPEYSSAQEYFNLISREITAEQAKDLNGVFSFNVEGSGLWIIEFTPEGDVRELDPDDDVEPDCIIAAKESDWLSIVSGQMKPMSAFITGKLKVKGSTGKAMKLQQVIGQAQD